MRIAMCDPVKRVDRSRSLRRGTVALAALALAGMACADPVPSSPRVDWQDGRLTIHASDVSYRELLSAIAAKTGIVVHGHEELAGTTSLSFTALPLQAGLEAALASMSYAIVGDTNAHAEHSPVVVIVAREKSPASANRLATAAAEHAHIAPGNGVQPDAYRTVERLAKQADRQALREAARYGEPLTQAIALQRLARDDPASARGVAIDVASSTDSAQRSFALQVLGGADGRAAIDALGVALDDADAGVRRAALVGLIGRSSPDVIALIARSVRDHDASIRSLALDILAQKGTAGVAGISEALNDPDPHIRAHARSILDRIHIR